MFTFLFLANIFMSMFSGLFLSDPVRFRSSSDFARHLFSFVPVYNLIGATQYILYTLPMAIRLNPGVPYDEIKNASVFGEYGVNIEIKMLLVFFVIYWLLLLIIMIGCCDSRKPKNPNE